jgi:hypothetical protein
MLKSTVAMMLAAGLSFAFVDHSYAQSCPSEMRFPVVRVIHHVKTCVYSCPAPCHVCQSDATDPKTGCSNSYRCTAGKPGSNDCP